MAKVFPGFVNIYSVDTLIEQARRLAAEYRVATGKPLPVSAEIANYDAARLLGLELLQPATSGFDAVGKGAREGLRYQIKGRAIFEDGKGGHRIGQLKMNQEWDRLALVLMDERYQPFEIYEADRQDIQNELAEGPATSRSKRGAMSVAKFKMIARLVWTREFGQEDDGYRDNR